MTTIHPELQAAFDWIDAHRDEAIADLQRFVQQKSVSAQNIGLEECAQLVVAHDARRWAGCHGLSHRRRPALRHRPCAQPVQRQDAPGLCPLRCAARGAGGEVELSALRRRDRQGAALGARGDRQQVGRAGLHQGRQGLAADARRPAGEREVHHRRRRRDRLDSPGAVYRGQPGSDPRRCHALPGRGRRSELHGAGHRPGAEERALCGTGRPGRQCRHPQPQRAAAALAGLGAGAGAQQPHGRQPADPDRRLVRGPLAAGRGGEWSSWQPMRRAWT